MCFLAFGGYVLASVGVNSLMKKKFFVLKVLSAWLILLLMPLALYGFFIEFIPNEITNKTAKGLAMVLTVVIFGFGFKIVTTKMMFKRKILQLIELVFRLFLISYTLHVCFAYAIPGLHARILGKTHANVQIVQPRENHASRECDFVIENKYLEPTLHGYICISEASYKTKDQIYILTGFQTPLGFYVKHAIPNSIFKQINQKILQERESS